MEKFSVIVSIEPTLPLYLTSVLGSLKFLAQVLSYLPLAAVYEALPPRHALCMKDVILFDAKINNQSHSNIYCIHVLTYEVFISASQQSHA